MTIGDVTVIIIHSKSFPVSDWLKPHAWFTITSCCSPNLKKIFVILNQWHQNDVKSAAHCRLLNRWPTKPGDEIVFFLVSGKTKNKERNDECPLRTGKYFEWIIKKLLNSAFIGYEEFCRSLLQIHFALRRLWITPFLINWKLLKHSFCVIKFAWKLWVVGLKKTWLQVRKVFFKATQENIKIIPGGERYWAGFKPDGYPGRRQCGQVVSISDLQSSSPGFKSHSDHYLDLFLGSSEFKSSATM